jgi:hypothetical protein
MGHDTYDKQGNISKATATAALHFPRILMNFNQQHSMVKQINFTVALPGNIDLTDVILISTTS